jgi:hypothetical protein
VSWRGKLETLRDRTRQSLVTHGLDLVDPELAPVARLRQPVLDVLPPDALALDPDIYVPQVELGAPGIEFRLQEQLRLLERLGMHKRLFAELRRDPSLSRGSVSADRLFNGQYHTPDAEVYAAMIADRRPRAIVEVGAGYSTRIARKTIDLLALPTELVVVDPNPRVRIGATADLWIQTRIENSKKLEVGATDFLFIDSSHVIRPGGDAQYLLNHLVPALPVGAVVHVHDVFCPWDYPDAYRRRLYTEQYVVQALLSGSRRYRILFATHLMARRHTEGMRAAFGPTVGAGQDHHGSSLWFEVGAD